jgi:flavin reductase ActVB
MDLDAFKAAMSRFPAGVTVVTTRDADLHPWGFTASSFASLSLDPPLVLVCLAGSADCSPAFSSCERMAISILSGDQEEVAMRFASKTRDKFAEGDWHDAGGLPVIDGARAVISGPVEARHPGGDHTILVLRIETVTLGDSTTSLTYSGRSFHELP